MAKTIEAVAKSFWDTRAGLPCRERLEPQTSTHPSHKWVSSPILWDDEDMLETDREAYRQSTRAAILALAANVSPEMVEAARNAIRLRGHGLATTPDETFDAIVAALLSATEDAKHD